MAQNASLPSKPSILTQQHCMGNIIPLRQKILPRHRNLLSRWLNAGQRMGLLDACVTPLTHATSLSDRPEQIIVWVRENASPAYIIRPQGHYWCLIDALQERELGRYRCFNTTLNSIRPALSQHDITSH